MIKKVIPALALVLMLAACDAPAEGIPSATDSAASTPASRPAADTREFAAFFNLQAKFYRRFAQD